MSIQHSASQGPNRWICSPNSAYVRMSDSRWIRVFKEMHSPVPAQLPQHLHDEWTRLSLRIGTYEAARAEANNSPDMSASEKSAFAEAVSKLVGLNSTSFHTILRGIGTFRVALAVYIIQNMNEGADRDHSLLAVGLRGPKQEQLLTHLSAGHPRRPVQTASQ